MLGHSGGNPGRGHGPSPRGGSDAGPGGARDTRCAGRGSPVVGGISGIFWRDGGGLGFRDGDHRVVGGKGVGRGQGDPNGARGAAMDGGGGVRRGEGGGERGRGVRGVCGGRSDG
jgi:hypothetical protein